MFIGFFLFIVSIYAFKINDKFLQYNNYYLTSSLKVVNFSSKHQKAHYLPVILHNNLCNMCLIENSNSGKRFFNPNMEILLYNNGQTSKTFLNKLRINFVHGYIVGHENDSAVDGFIDNNFYGRIAFNDSLYYVTKKDFFSDIFKNQTEARLSTLIFKYEDEWLSHHSLLASKKLLQTYTFIGNICSLIILIDYSFYHLVGMDSYKHSVATVLSVVKRANSIFRSTDFNNDGIPDNIGFRVKKIFVMQSSKDQEPYILPFTQHPCSSQNFILTVSKFPNFKDACLGVVFTAQSFLGNVIGLSYAASLIFSGRFYASFGGICRNSLEESYNVVLVTFFHNNIRLTEYYNDLSLTHEFGHSFGSQHDDTMCGKGFIMDSKTPKFFTTTSFLFSSCSKYQMNYIINSRWYCFEKDDEEFCGNEILETKEECDCGSYYNCINNDNCCLPNVCKVNREKGYTCHPSQGLCCLSSCKLRDLSKYGLSCENFEKTCGEKEDASCGVEGSCRQNYCHSIECTRMGLPECSCPLNKTIKDCQTCCNYKGSCVTAVLATKMQIRDDLSWVTKLFKIIPQKNPGSKNIRGIEICYGGRCIIIPFRVFQPGTFCLLHGKLGYCKSNAGCFIPNKHFSKIPFYGSSSKMYSALKTNLFLILFCKLSFDIFIA